MAQLNVAGEAVRVMLAGLKQRARELKTEVIALYLAARHPLTPWYAKLLLALIVAYALSPIDLIPDFVPVLGFVDDIVLLPLGIALAVKMIPAGVMAECRELAAQQRPDITRAGRVGAAIVVALWLALIVLAGLWAYDAFASTMGGGEGRGLEPTATGGHNE